MNDHPVKPAGDASGDSPQVMETYSAEVAENTDSVVIKVLEDKLRVVLMEHLAGFEKSRDWQTPLTAFVSLVATLSTTDFKDVHGLSKDTWRAIFIILTIGSFLWLGRNLIRISRRPTIDSLITKIKAKEDKRNKGRVKSNDQGAAAES